MQCAERILLTGAGFTRNFGGFLANEMWYEIFNHSAVQVEPRVKSIMLNNENFDYESIYQEIMEGRSTEAEKNAIHEAVMDTYKSLDNTIKDWCFTKDSLHPVNIHLLSQLISRLSDDNVQGYFFTLNQDLFIERHYTGRPCSSPGIQWNPGFMRYNMPGLELTKEDYCRLPNKDELDAKREEISKTCKFMYIKLHGSYGWLSFDGSAKIVLGGGKLEQIQKEPLLSWYFEIFKNALFRPECHLLIIGYGFTDEHINQIIVDAIKKTGLKILILTPQSQKELFNERIAGLDSGIRERIWSGASISGYIKCDLLQMFPSDQSISQHYRSLLKNFFGLNVR